MRPIVLIGLPGSGKSTVGKELSKRLGRKFTDLDAEIEKETGRAIAEIFRDEGEAVFRALESSHLEQALNAAAPLVIAAGGGVVEREYNRRLLKLGSLTVYLEIPTAEAAARVQADEAKRPSSGRPLFKGTSTAAATAARLEELLKRREEYYRGADVIVPSGGRSVDEIAADVEAAVRST